MQRTNRIFYVSCAKDLSVSQGTIGNWESGNRTPDALMLKKIADYYDCSLDYLLERTNDIHGTTPQLSAKDERDIGKILQNTREQLENQEGLMFDGDPASQEAIESILAAMELGLQAAKHNN